MTGKNQHNCFITPELTHRSELILHLLEYSNKLVVVKGEQDSGKTTFFKELLNQEESNLILRNLTLSISSKPNDIIKAVIEGSVNDELQNSDYSQADLNQWLTRCQNKQQIPALLIDNADLLDEDLLIYLLELLKQSNEASVLHVCLFCEPSFLEQLEESGLNRDDSDSLHIIEMPNLTDKQTEQYIRNYYPTDNATGLSLFDDKTIKHIHRISHGLPGRINALCDQYLDDPAKKTEEVKEKKTSIDIKEFFLKNKLIIIVVALLMALSVGIATLLQQAEEVEVKQTIKLNLPKLDGVDTKPDDVVEINVPEELEPEPVTIEELSAPVIPEIVKDQNDKSGVTVYNAQGRIIAQESDIKPPVKEVSEEVVVQELIEEEVIESGVPIITPTEDPKSIVQILPEPVTEPEPEPIKAPEPKPEPVKAPEPKSESIVKDIKWLTQQDPKKYVLQLIGAYEQETIDVYLRSFKDNKDKIISFTASNKGKEWHVLVYGLYANRDQAVAAIETLPTKAKLMAPWPRTVQSIKDLVQ